MKLELLINTSSPAVVICDPVVKRILVKDME